MKAILEFDLETEGELFELSKNGPKLKWKIDEFDQWLRKIIKYGEEKDQMLDAQAVRDKLWEFLTD